MGIGDAISGIFGGGNNYQYQQSPFVGSPQDYTAQNQAFNRQVNNASNLNVPGHVLNFGANKGESNQQQDLINQILAQGQGQGPNPAMDQLRMTTDQNARSAAGLLGSQHNLNPALAARMAAQGLGQANQQAAGQGALMSAQQQLGAQQLGGQMLDQRIGQQSQNAIAQGQAGLGLLGARLGAEQTRRAAQQNYQNMVNQQYGNMNNVNAGTSAQNAQTAGGYGQGIMSGISSGLGAAAMMNEGGEVNPFQNHVAQKLAGGGTAQSFMNFQGADPMAQFMAPGSTPNMAGMSSGLASVLHGAFQSPLDSMNPTNPNSGSHPFSPDTMLSAHPFDPANMSVGGKILGKAEVKGDSEINDNVPALLSPGEVVIPRTAMKNAESAHDFLDRIIQKNDGPRYGDILQAKMKYHNMAHGGEMKSCGYCNGGMA